ncbi:hypothetical protein LX99_03976 [Mucilaginibacter oryzae]|uniref:Uncharacterized protein n=1 Tax=Mucilaginibacter oryzae TaxID=468058 RepID=A0A316HJQ2_9SPHI|nr:hypothetical protein [Mucilaginibacter oryzae]PWK74175.1 hypothetical protein LX99_03976 [Mucilaginibacter oryzae]
MNWNHLFLDFSNGDTNAIQAIFSILSFGVTLAGTLYVVKTFNQQKQINLSQLDLNKLALEKDKRDLLPMFIGKSHEENQIEGIIEYDLILKYNKARDIEIFPINQRGDFLSPIYYPTQISMPKDDKPFTTIKIKVADSCPPSSFDKQYLLYYTDEVGRPYTQEIGHDAERAVILYPQSVDTNFRRNLPFRYDRNLTETNI